eukprot:7261222-Pyramimonas_sp.AAC.2
MMPSEVSQCPPSESPTCSVPLNGSPSIKTTPRFQVPPYPPKSTSLPKFALATCQHAREINPTAIPFSSMLHPNDSFRLIHSLTIN